MKFGRGFLYHFDQMGEEFKNEGCLMEKGIISIDNIDQRLIQIIEAIKRDL